MQLLHWNDILTNEECDWRLRILTICCNLLPAVRIGVYLFAGDEGARTVRNRTHRIARLPIETVLNGQRYIFIRFHKYF